MKWLLLALVLIPTSANADPVTLFFVGLGASAATAAILTNIVISIGLNIVLSAITPRPKSGQGQQSTPTQNVQVNTTAFDRPFDYRLQVNDPGREKTLNVDLAETACLMLGLSPVRAREVARTVGTVSLRYRLVEGWLVQQGNKLALMVLRDYIAPADANAAKVEYDWLAATVQSEFSRALADYATLYYNRDLMLFGGENGKEREDNALHGEYLERAG